MKHYDSQSPITNTIIPSGSAESPLIRTYVNPFSDFGFKKLFKEPQNQDILVDFLQTILQPHKEQILSVEPMDPEQLGVTEEDRTAIYDLKCMTQGGTTILIEMQNSKQDHFIDRTEFYKSKLIVAQSHRGNWDYRLDKVYLINIMNFPCEQMASDPSKYRSTVMPMDIETGQVWSDKVVAIYLDLHTFKKLKTHKGELANRYEEWLYYMSYLEEFKRMTEKTNDPIFDKFFSSAELARMSKEDQYL